MSNVDKVKIKPIPIELDKARTIVFDLNAYAELEDKYGSIEKAMEALETGSIKAVRAVLWAGLLHEDEKLTEKQVGAMIGMQEMKTLTQSIMDGISSSMPVPEEPVEGQEEEEDPKKPPQ